MRTIEKERNRASIARVADGAANGANPAFLFKLWLMMISALLALSIANVLH